MLKSVEGNEGAQSILNAALWAALQERSPALVRQKLEAGADPNLVVFPYPLSPASWETVLFYAVAHEDLRSVKHLLFAGANPNAQDGHGPQALCKAACRGWERGISVLLAAGADPTLIDADNNNVLHHVMSQTLANRKNPERILRWANDARLDDHWDRPNINGVTPASMVEAYDANPLPLAMRNANGLTLAQQVAVQREQRRLKVMATQVVLTPETEKQTVRL